MINVKTLRLMLNSLIFLVGFLSCLLVFLLVSYAGIEKPLSLVGLGVGNSNSTAPGDWIKIDDISLTDEAIIINVKNATLSQYAPTGSMRPVFDSGANGIRIVPESAEQINVGDIVTFGETNIVHRVIEKGEDDSGFWFITKGDNNDISDGMIRFEDIQYVTIGVLY